MLVEVGADVNAADPDGISPIVIALINGHYDVAGALIESRHGRESARQRPAARALYAAVDFNTMPASNRPAPK